MSTSNDRSDRHNETDGGHVMHERQFALELHGRGEESDRTARHPSTNAHGHEAGPQPSMTIAPAAKSTPAIPIMPGMEGMSGNSAWLFWFALGSAAVTAIKPAGERGADEVLALAAAAEAGSGHPLA